MEIPVLNMWQPWASLVAHGRKKIETRAWPWHRCPTVVAIYATKAWSGRPADEYPHLCQTDPFAPVLIECGYRTVEAIPTGKMIALARIDASVKTADLAWGREPARPYLHLMTPHEFAFGDYAAGRYGFVLGAVHRLEEPIEARGRQGVWKWQVPDELAGVVRELEGQQ